jgi:hypothetical protein
LEQDIVAMLASGDSRSSGTAQVIIVTNLKGKFRTESIPRRNVTVVVAAKIPPRLRERVAVRCGHHPQDPNRRPRATTPWREPPKDRRDHLPGVMGALWGFVRSEFGA